MRFEYLEHIDDDLSWDGVQAALQAAVRPWRTGLLFPCMGFRVRSLGFKFKDLRFCSLRPGTVFRELPREKCSVLQERAVCVAFGEDIPKPYIITYIIPDSISFSIFFSI